MISKEQAILQFKYDVVPVLEEDTAEERQTAWKLYLETLYLNHEIDEYQREFWKLPKEILQGSK